MILLFIFQLAFSAPSLNISDINMRKPQDEFKCYSNMQKLISQQQPKDEWRRKVNPDMSLSFVRPTKALSRWIRLEKKGEFEVFKRQTPFDEMVVTFNRRCEGKMTVHKVSSYNLKDGFTDFHLAELLSQHSKGLILSWSPGMNLSIEAIKNAQQAALSKKIHLTILLDPYADITKTKAILLKQGIKDVELRKISSFELINRNVLLHFPNLVMYKNGEITGPIVPGLMNHADYEFLATKYLEIK